MTIKDVLYRETLVRVGAEEMRGVKNLLDAGHRGIAEKHTVGKLLHYIKNLEKQLGVTVPSVTEANVPLRKVNDYRMGGTYYIQA